MKETCYLRLSNKCLYLLCVAERYIIKKGQCRDTAAKLLPIATLTRRGTCTFQADDS